MFMIEIQKLSNGSHRNQKFLSCLPAGWAVVPDDLETANFPFGEVETEIVDGIETVTKWTDLPIPEPVPVPDNPTQLDRVEAQALYTALMTDTLLED